MVKLVMTYIGILAGLALAQYLLGGLDYHHLIKFLEGGLIVLVCVFILRGFKL